MKNPQQTEERKENARKFFQECLPAGSTVYTILLNVTPKRYTFAVLIAHGNEVKNVSSFVCFLTGLEFDQKWGGVKVRQSPQDIVEEMIHEMFGNNHIPNAKDYLHQRL